METEGSFRRQRYVGADGLEVESKHEGTHQQCKLSLEPP